MNKLVAAMGWTLLGILFSSPLLAKQEVRLWSYYEFPPFVISSAEKVGLSYDFVEMMNLFEDNEQYEFVLEILPRKRLDAYLSKGKKGAVLWVNPLFFNDLKKEKYFWTKRLLEDEQSFVSRAKDPFIFKGPKSLMNPGFVLGGMRGHIYGGIQNEIDQGLIIRTDVDKEKQNIGMLLKKRVNVFLIPYTAMKYYEKRMNLYGKIFYSPKPLNTYSRSIMVSHDRAVYDFLSKVVDESNKDEYWKALLDQYNLKLPTGKDMDF